MFDEDSFDTTAFSDESFLLLTIIAYSIRRLFEVGIEKRSFLVVP